MAVPSTILDLSTNTASNSPLGSENVGSPGSVDDYFRSIEAILRGESLLKSWEVRGDVPTYISGTEFSVPGDQTSYYKASRRVQANGGAIIFGAILSTSYNGVISTVTLLPDSGLLDASLSSVYLGIDPLSAAVILTGSYYPLGGGNLNGAMSLSNRDIAGVKVLGMFAEFDNGNSGAGPKTIDWSMGQDQKITLNAATPALVILPAPAVGHYQLRLIQDAVGARAPTFTGIAASRWLNSTVQPTFNTAANGETIITLFWDGALFTQGSQKVGVA
jgi:hypothetical protein